MKLHFSRPLLGLLAHVAAAIGVCVLLSAQPAYADQVSVIPSDCPRDKVTIFAFGQTYKLLDVFSNEEEALDIFLQMYPDFINEAEHLGLPALSTENATLYKTYSMSLEGTLEDDEWAEILAFLDIFENRETNRQIETEIRELEAQAAAANLTSDVAQTLAEKILPMSNGQSTAPIEPFNSGINLADARSYAERYATTPNGKYGYETTWFNIGADCTNFASQILYAGGISMDSSYNTNEGWWWRAINQRSVSWIQAATFANYMGSGYSTTSWTSFVSNVRAGDFIGYDSGGDGEVDHVGFVHSKSGGELYIAQHTSDYIKWDNDTGWPDIKGRYYRIRR